MQTTSCTTYIFASNLHIQTQRKGLRAPQPFWPSGKRILIAQWCFYSPFPWQVFLVGWLVRLCVCLVLVLVLVCLHGTTDSPGSKKKKIKLTLFIQEINQFHIQSKMGFFMTWQVFETKAWAEVTTALETGVAVLFFFISAITAFSCITINTLCVPNHNEPACSPWTCLQSEVRTNELSGPQEEDKDVEAEGKE